MKKKLLFMLFIMVAVLSASLFAQETEKDSTYNKENDDEEVSSEDWSKDDEEDDDDEDEWTEHWQKWHHEWNWEGFNGQPTLEAAYGMSAIGIKSLSKDFADAGAVEVKMSYSSLKNRGNYIAKYKNDYGFVSTSSMDLSSNKGSVNDLTSKTWRFGLGWQRAYAYKFGNSAIIPYNSFGFVWTRLENYEDRFAPGIGIIDDRDYYNYVQRLDDFKGSFRFGQLAEGGIKIQVLPLLTFNAGYERAVVFRRHLFWKHAGSLLIEGAGMGLIDTFVGRVLYSSPGAAPIVNFVLKNGFSYALYQLRKERMNWPFVTAEPLTYDTWKVGMTFTF